ncbi:MAG: hypothetical protein IJT18_01710 [Oscillospiraceae bacterium]|nr:hypothetical protein [Oscillospiraceae bacterium]
MRLFRGRLLVSPLLPILSAFFLYLGYGTVWGLLLFAALLHECGHLLALRLCRAELHTVRIGALGAEIVTTPLTRSQELFCAAAGPAANLIFCALSLLPGWRLFALLHAALLLFNLLPVYPLDGGRMLRAFLVPYGDRAARIVSAFFCAALSAAAIYASIRSRDPLPAAAAAVIALRAWTET